MKPVRPCNGVYWFVGLRYVGIQSDTHLLSFLARVAMLGLVLGSSLLIVVLSVMNGFDRELRERILNIVPHISLYADTTQSPVAKTVDWMAVRKEVLDRPEVLEAIPFIEIQGLLKNGEQAEPLLFYGIEDFPALHDYITDVDLKNWQDNPGGLLVGATVAEKMHLSTGDEVLGILSIDNSANTSSNESSLHKMTLQRFQVAGIFDTKTELDKALVIAHEGILEQVSGVHTPQGLRLRVKDLFRAPIIEWQLLQKLPENIYARNWSQTHGNLYEAVQMSRSLVSLLMFVIIAVAVFNVVSTLMLVVIEKKQAIAILQVQGANRRDIMRIFIVQGVTIGLIGSCIGALLGMLVSLILPDLVAFVEHALHFQFLKTDVYPISYIPSDLRFSQVAVVVFIATFFSFIASLYPAWRATRVDPAQVLRYE